MNYGDGETQGYGFDAMGNRLSKTDNVTGNESYTFNNANMLLSRNSNGYTNDLDGNTLTGGGRTSVWDSQNRMVSCVDGSNTSTYVYGADGYRHQSTVNGVAADFVLDGQFVTRERRSGINYATYFIGANGPLYRRDDTSGSVRWYLFDGLGSVLGEVDPAGNVTDFNKYDVYGALRSRTGTATTSHGFVGQLGHTSEAETGLIYMRARYMDPVVGRFISEDPQKSGQTWYSYCDNSPTNVVDPTGRDGELIGLAVGMAIGGTMECLANGWSVTNFLAGAAVACFTIIAALVPGWGVVLGAIVGGAASGIDTALRGGTVSDVMLSVLLGGACGALEVRPKSREKLH